MTQPATEVEELLITRFHPVRHYATKVPDSERLKGVFADVETTGLDPDRDKIIQLALVPFTFARDGQVCTTEPAFVELEEPGVEIPEEVVKLTGITEEMVKGKRINSHTVETICSDADIVICHNAEFDRQFMENRWHFLTRTRFGCSMRDVPWAECGFTSLKLEWLMFKHLGLFYDGHRADMDCYAGIHLLQSNLAFGHRPLEAVLDAARAGRIRIWACGAPYETRHVLKQRKYKWSDGNSRMPKAWYIDVRLDDYDDERAWLAENVFDRGDLRSVVAVRFDSRQRFSNRIVP